MVTEREAMARALDLAWRGWGRAQPNPLVGAVVLAGGEPVGEGWHAEYGDRHAETIALAAAGERARGATVVCTLEPCNHAGKQPPCTDAIVAAGVRRVVAAVADPNPSRPAAPPGFAGGRRGRGRPPRRRGRGAERHLSPPAARPEPSLRSAQARYHNRRPHRRRQQPSRWLSAERARVRALAARGIRRPRGGRRDCTDRRSLPHGSRALRRGAARRIVFAADGDVPPSLRLVRTARETPTIAVVAPLTPAQRLVPLEAAGVTIVHAASLAEALGALRAAGIDSLLVEGGGRLAGALLSAELVDRYYWVQTPLWLGVGAAPAMAGLPTTPLSEARRWRVTDRRALGDDTLLVLDRA
jgi:diaminohydroxyphosphoribosylaminopyrimidine deaminase/5-amino-6-(5-phosphoribosylamino)uracil reductase